MQAEAQTSDPCSQPYQVWGSRAVVLTICFLVMILGSVAVFIILGESWFALETASVVGETAAVILYTFSRNWDNPPYLYSCPVVQSQFPSLIGRHGLFLFAIVALETIAFGLRPQFSTWLFTANGGNETLSTIVLTILVGALTVVEIMSNRSLLQRAHQGADV